MAVEIEEVPGQLTWVSGLEKQRKKRFSSKVKTGCETCKKRRVKCDEGKPTCANCNRSGRRCEGYQSMTSSFYWYEHDGQGIKNKDPAIISQVDLKYGTPGDKALLDMFLNRTAAEIVKFSNPYFWYTLVPQASWSHEGIRQAVAAVALACDEADRCELMAVSRKTRSIYHYNAAIRSLTVTDGEKPPTDVMLICCIMFWLFENLKNRPCIAMTHLKAAVNMLNERSRPPSHREDLISSYIEPLLQESMLFAATVLPTGGRKHHDAPATMGAYEAVIAKLQPSESPKDLHTCRFDFGRCQQGLVIAKQMQMSKSSPDPDMDLVRKLYTDWRKALDSNAHKFPSEYVRMLRMHHASQMIALDIVESDILGINARESPEWRPRLRWTLDEARYFASLKQAQAKDHNHQSVINLSLITLLSMTARQCIARDSDFAEEAIGLLEDYQWFEGMWSSKVAGELQRLMRTIDAEHRLCRSGDLEEVFERAAVIKDDVSTSMKRNGCYIVPSVSLNGSTMQTVSS